MTAAAEKPPKPAAEPSGPLSVGTGHMHTTTTSMVLALALGAAGLARAGEPLSVGLTFDRGASVDQTGPTPPTEAAFWTFRVVASEQAGDLTAVSISWLDADGEAREAALEPVSDIFWLFAPPIVDTLEELEAEWPPAETYVFDATLADGGSAAATVLAPPSLYPGTVPAVTNWSDWQDVHPAAPPPLEITSWTPPAAATTATTSVVVGDNADPSLNFFTMVEPSTTAITLPEGFLRYDRSYTVFLFFEARVPPRVGAGGPVVQHLFEIDTRVILTTAEAPCGGDIDGDGAIDLADLNALLATFGSEVDPGTGADLDADGDVDLVDLNILLANWQQSC